MARADISLGATTMQVFLWNDNAGMRHDVPIDTMQVPNTSL